MAGRAGRRGMDEEGLVVMRMNLEDFPDMLPRIERYMNHSYEPVHSQFSLSFNSVVNLLHHHPLERIQQLVERPFCLGRASKERKNVFEKPMRWSGSCCRWI